MWRIGFSLFLALVLSWASVPMAVARASMAASVTICTGDGAQVVTLDANGDRVAITHCPDCSIAAAALLPVPTCTAHRIVTARHLTLSLSARQSAPQTTPRPAARSPPPLA
jgi:hypothetical protein